MFYFSFQIGVLRYYAWMLHYVTVHSKNKIYHTNVYLGKLYYN